MIRIYSFLYFITLSFIVVGQEKVGTEIGLWTIKNGEIILNNNESDVIGIEYWSFITNTLPHEPIKQYITSFRLYTDGIQEDLGGMNSLNGNNSEWQIELDVKDTDLSSHDEKVILDYQHTLIHEFGHVLTLNASQIEPTDDQYQDNDKGYLTSEGYAKEDSYLGQYIKLFWKNDLLFEWDKIDAIKNERRKLKKLYTFYLIHEEEFVTDYATETPEEDIAEAWTFFVLDEISSPTTIKEQKITFFSQFPELIKYRNEIRENLKIIPANYLENYTSD
ncbi:putative zinc-binding metallopeptidase [Flammeovirga kamogawensis]|uniref:Zinc-dependent peptidase n=1 Tax=Flammeovirga kamogawensis TaxID=373891 RepID=A0ABX8GWX5_9BACT|nr:putative zinc-binding metallopeptidase [Flammeovirga kamogawensis]MBB6460565.1 hypothetical protein [Flammeovirga kamogawensis]QWG07924.1 hypothetical protein KM029_03035 [Flammeovirga kamogawensis]TRX69731.1 hypothetical protein EO216_16965 [Flammeovirga kamogawensis]